nr:T9SS type A sorting domain-containing protein [Bacteroidota bacterium]
MSEFQQEGGHEVLFNGTDLPAGIYFCRLQAGDEVLTKKIIKLK